MMLYLVLLLGIPNPERVTTVGVGRYPDGTVRLNWTLPADPSIVGVTLYRYRFRDNELVIFEIQGLTDGYDDVSAQADESYDYWVHTRDTSGLNSIGRVVTTFQTEGDGHSEFYCTASLPTDPGRGAIPFVVGGVLLALFAWPRRAHRTGSSK